MRLGLDADTINSIAVVKCSAHPKNGIQAKTDVTMPRIDPYFGSLFCAVNTKVIICNISMMSKAKYQVDITIAPPNSGKF